MPATKAASPDAVGIAKVLSEALPYIQRFRGKTMVIKCGGNSMAEERSRACFARDITLMKLVGMNPVVVHGGGPQINELLLRLGEKVRFVEGMRVTNRNTMDVVEMVLGGLLNKELVGNINQQGGRAVGLSGKDGGLIRARRLASQERAREGVEEQMLELGFVGEVTAIDPSLVHTLAKEDFIPVIAPIGIGEKGVSYNINADMVAGKLAETLRAEKLIILSDVPGLSGADGEILRQPSLATVQDLIVEGGIQGGMLPKLNAILEALQGGVGAAHIIDGRVDHALLIEVFTDYGIGTLLRADGV